MTNGQEKSDPAIVAAKSANKAGRPGTEQMEPRAGAKGNAGQLHTDRTQSRATVSQGLTRIREAAKNRKGERFTSLLHHVDVALLEQAYKWLKQDAAPGPSLRSLGTRVRKTLICRFVKTRAQGH